MADATTADDTGALETVVSRVRIVRPPHESVIYVARSSSIGPVESAWRVACMLEYPRARDRYVARFRQHLLRQAGLHVRCELADLASLKRDYRRLLALPAEVPVALLTPAFVHGEDARRAVIDLPLVFPFVGASIGAISRRDAFRYCSVNGDPYYKAVAPHGALFSKGIVGLR